MSDIQKAENAAKNYRLLCAALDHRGWRYEKEDDRMAVIFKVTGEDLPMLFRVAIDTPRQLARFSCFFPFKMSEEKRIDGAIATCAASQHLAMGGFDYDISDGEIMFRINAHFLDSELSEDLFNYLISMSCKIVDTYNDQFLAIDKGLISLESFLDRN